jgi:hypothetical protein
MIFSHHSMSMRGLFYLVSAYTLAYVGFTAATAVLTGPLWHVLILAVIWLAMAVHVLPARCCGSAWRPSIGRLGNLLLLTALAHVMSFVPVVFTEGYGARQYTAMIPVIALIGLSGLFSRRYITIIGASVITILVSVLAFFSRDAQVIEQTLATGVGMIILSHIISVTRCRQLRYHEHLRRHHRQAQSMIRGSQVIHARSDIARVKRLVERIEPIPRSAAKFQLISHRQYSLVSVLLVSAQLISITADVLLSRPRSALIGVISGILFAGISLLTITGRRNVLHALSSLAVIMLFSLLLTLLDAGVSRVDFTQVLYPVMLRSALALVFVSVFLPPKYLIPLTFVSQWTDRPDQLPVWSRGDYG